MGFYSRYVLPRLVDHVCSRRTHMKQREKVVPLAEGRVLDVGFGTGLNLTCLDREKVSRLWALDPSAESFELARRAVDLSGIETEYLEAGAESIPLESASVDSIIVTYSLCSIADRLTALGEMRRVLVEGGHIFFCEHGLAPDPGPRRWQQRLSPVWKTFSGGCELTVDVPSLLREGGFEVEWMDTMYLSGFRPASFNYWGAAR
ncbi:MAG TPA: class I SAM-dependent methyltransferase [Gammaproteobacteria bacterium]|nr:class I SAM-dependent methyltransferase [Gammaproteobacteria bacterium]